MGGKKLLTNVYLTRKKGQNFIHIFLRDLFSEEVEDYLIPIEKTEGSSLRRFFSEKKVDPLGVYRVEENSNKIELYKERILKFDEFSGLKSLSFDIEALNPHRLPNPERDPIVSLAYKCNGSEKVINGREEEILREFREDIKKENPYFLISFNGDAFDNPYLLRRTKVLYKQRKLEKDYTLSPYSFSPRSLPLPVVFGRTKGISYPGIFTLDLLYFAKLMPLAQVNLDFLAKTFGLKSEKIEIKDLFKLVKRNELEPILRHNLSDARVTHEIWKILAKPIYLIARNAYGSLEYVTRAINSLPELMVNKLCIAKGKEMRRYNFIGKKLSPSEHLILKEGFYPRVKVENINFRVAKKLVRIYKSMETWCLENLIKLYSSDEIYGIKIDDVSRLVLEGLIKKSILFFEKVHTKIGKLVRSIRKSIQDEILKRIPRNEIVYLGRDFGVYLSKEGRNKALVVGESFFIKEGDFIISNSTFSKIVRNIPPYTSKTLTESLIRLFEGEKNEEIGKYILRRRKNLRETTLKELILIKKKRGEDKRIILTQSDKLLDSLDFPYEEGTHVEVVMTKKGPKDVNKEKIKRDEIDWDFYEKNFDKAFEKIGKIFRYQNGALVQSLFAYM